MITVLADGNFDGLHWGHIAHLRVARDMGDRLVVALASDAAVAHRKGPGRPRFSFAERKRMLLELSSVDKVVENPGSTALITQLQPDIYVKGIEYQDIAAHPDLMRAIEALRSYGGEFRVTDTQLASSTSLFNDHLPLRALPPEIRQRYDYRDVCGWLDRAKALAPQVIGERILDRYIYVQPQHKSAKDEVITYLQIGEESFAGGVDAIIAHLSESTTAPTLLSNTPQVQKCRYVSQPFLHKVASIVAEHEVAPYSPPARIGPGLTIVADYGHGLVSTKGKARAIAEKVEYLALMSQSNSVNWGYNLLTKWPRADYFVVDEQELRLAKSDRWTSPMKLLQEECQRLGASLGAVTLGHQGVLLHGLDGFYQLPALTTHVVDRMGAGDAFYAWTAPLAYIGAPIEIVALIGNIAGAMHCGIVGNKEPVRRAQVERWLKGLLT